MTSKPITVSGDTGAAEALDLMVERGIRHLPVLAAEGELIGILSIDDLRATLPFDVKQRLDPLQRERLGDFRVSDAMTWAPLRVQPSTSLEEASRTLSKHRIGCLPVVETHGELVGILSETDALRALDALLRKEVPPSADRMGESESLTDALRSEHQRLVEQLAKWQADERELSADIREEPRDSADRAADEGGVANLEFLSARAARRLRAIELALDRARRGRFGICERCQGRIPATRLRAIPETALCVRCPSATADAQNT
jgi:acetoin utilization protein AcuB